MKRPLSSLGLVLLVLSLGCSSSLPPDRVAAGTYRQKMKPSPDSPKRTYRLHVPTGYDETRPLPLVVVIHGAFSNPGQMAELTGFDELADREDFVVAYPEGIGILGLFRHWNAGFCCGKALADGIDDAGFVAGVVDEVTGALTIDPDRVYLVGYSNGGMLAYLVSAELTEQVAATAVFAATIGVRSTGGVEHLVPDPLRPLPILHLHGRADENVPFEGGKPSRDQSFALASAHDSAAFWASENGCGEEPTRLVERGGGIVRETWSSGCAEAPVVLLTLGGWGHSWPGPHFTDDLEEDDPLRGYDAAEVIWDFFEATAR